jgi:hypothetical protein
LRKQVYGRKVGSISPNKIGDTVQNHSPTLKYRYDSPSKMSMKKFDNYRLKTTHQMIDNINKFSRAQQ